MGKLTMTMAIFHGYVEIPEGLQNWSYNLEDFDGEAVPGATPPNHLVDKAMKTVWFFLARI